jgi:hypothetical protein
MRPAKTFTNNYVLSSAPFGMSIFELQRVKCAHNDGRTARSVNRKTSGFSGESAVADGGCAEPGGVHKGTSSVDKGTKAVNERISAICERARSNSARSRRSYWRPCARRFGSRTPHLAIGRAARLIFVSSLESANESPDDQHGIVAHGISVGPWQSATAPNRVEANG